MHKKTENSLHVGLITILFICLSSINTLSSARGYPQPVAGNFEIQNFQFEQGGELARLNLHYRTIGKPVRGADGKTNNAVLIMHGTAGSGEGFLTESFAGHLISPGQPLDAEKYYIILPDAIGHGASSRASDGLKMGFPEYTYNDMVRAQYRLLTEHLGIDHLRLVTGTSMGGMHTWMWGYQFPDFMDALMPIMSMPVEIAGRNRMLRKMILNLIMNDPMWNDGNYEEQPQGLVYAMYPLLFMISSPIQYHRSAPTRESAEKFLEEKSKMYASRLDANDLIYQFDASRYYNPYRELYKIKAPLFAINSADDEVNPPELGIMEESIKKVRNGRYILLPITDESSGHATYMTARLWSKYLLELLEISEN